MVGIQHQGQEGQETAKQSGLFPDYHQYVYMFNVYSRIRMTFKINCQLPYVIFHVTLVLKIWVGIGQIFFYLTLLINIPLAKKIKL